MWCQNLWTGGQDKRKSPRCNELVYYHAKSNPMFCPQVQLHSHQLKGLYSYERVKTDEKVRTTVQYSVTSVVGLFQFGCLVLLIVRRRFVLTRWYWVHSFSTARQTMREYFCAKYNMWISDVFYDDPTALWMIEIVRTKPWDRTTRVA